MEPLRRLITWFAPSPGPLELLKQSIRDLEDQVPKLNENLSMIKAQVNLVEQELARLRAKEAELQEKVRAAVTESHAANYAMTLAEVRRELARHERRLSEVSATFELAQKAKRSFMNRKEERIQVAKAAFDAQRDADWNRKVAHDLRELEGEDDASHIELLRCFEAERRASERDLQELLDRLAGRPRHTEALLSKLGALRRDLAALEARAASFEQQLRPPS
jgi:phage shock protein A